MQCRSGALLKEIFNVIAFGKGTGHA
jgi:hypothetical protein